MSHRKGVKLRRNYSLETKRNTLKMIAPNANNTTLTEVSKVTGIPKETLRTWNRKRHTFIEREDKALSLEELQGLWASKRGQLYKELEPAVSRTIERFMHHLEHDNVTECNRLAWVIGHLTDKLAQLGGSPLGSRVDLNVSGQVNLVHQVYVPDKSSIQEQVIAGDRVEIPANGTDKAVK